MKRKFYFKILALSMVMIWAFGIKDVMGNATVYVMDLGAQNSAFGTSLNYEPKTGTVDGVTWHINTATCQSAAAVWLGTNSVPNYSNLAKLDAGLNGRGEAIATALGISASVEGYYAIAGMNNIMNVAKITVKATGTGGTAPSSMWCLYTTDNGLTYSLFDVVQPSPGSNLVTFTAIAEIPSAQYAFVWYSSAFGNYRAPKFEFISESITAQVATPTFSIAGGNYNSTLNVAINCSTPAVTIFYTLDGTTPTTSSSVYSSAIYVTSSTTIKAFAVKEDYYNSEIAEVSYILDIPSGFFEDFEHTAWSVGGTGYANRTVTDHIGAWSVSGVSSMVAGSDRFIGTRSIRFRGNTTNDIGAAINKIEMTFDKTDGLGTLSFLYASYAAHSGGILTAYYSIDQGATWITIGTVTAPLWSSVNNFSLAEFPVNIPGNVRVKIEKTPQTGNTSVNVDNISLTDYSTPHVPETYIKISSIEELTDGYYVIAYGSTQAMNNTNAGTFFANSAISPVADVITDPDVSIVWKIETNGSNKTIYNEASSSYVSYSGSSNQAFATNPSPLTNAEMWTIDYTSNLFRIQSVNVSGRFLQYNITSPRFACYTSGQQNLTLYKLSQPLNKVATPTFNPPAGTYNSAQNVEISCETPDAFIGYQLNEGMWEPYSAPIAVTTTTTIKARAVKAGMDDSEIAEAQYVINLTPFISINPTSYNFGSKPINDTYTQAFTVTTANLTSALTVSVTGAGFSANISAIPQNATETTVTVSFNPTAAQSYSGTLNITGGGITDPNVALSGEGIILSDLIWSDYFEYTPGTLLTANGWSAHSGAGTNPITVSEGSLSYLSYEPSGIGNKVTLTTSGEDVNSSFSDNITSGTLYAALMVNLTSAQSAGDYFAHFLGQSTSTFSGRIFARTSGSGYQLGVSKAANTGVYANELLGFGTTYLVVMKYEIVPGTTNDIVSLFVNPIVGNPEPVTPDAIASDITGTDPTRIAGFALRQGTNTSAPQLALSGIRVAKTWEEAVKYLAPTQVATPTFSPVAGTYSEPQNITISCTTENATIYYTTNGSTPTTSSTVYTTAIPVATTTTIKAIAVKAGLDNSEIAEAQYVINLTPYISINPTSYNFGNKPINDTYTQQFTVETANLTSDLTVLITTRNGFSVDVATISQTATTTTLTVTFNPTAEQAYNATLRIAGGGLPNPEDVPLSGVGIIISDFIWGENFEYPAGSLLTANGWTAHSGAGTNPITVSEGSLSYLSYEPSGIGNKVTLTTSGEDVNCSFPDNITSGNLYAALMVNFTSAQATGDYFAHFMGQSSTILSGRIFARSSGAGYQLGIAKASGTGVYAETILNFGTTYLVVMKYEIITGATNDQVSIFINPVVGSSEPALPSAIASDVSGADPNYIAGFALRQGNAANAPALALDGIRVAYTWAEAVKYLPPTQVATPIFSPVAGTYPEPQNVTISCTTEDAIIYYTTDGSTPTTSSTVYTTAIPVATTTTIKAIAVKAGLDNSEIAEAQYVINLTPYISINPTSYNFGNKPINESYTQQFTVETANLTSDLTVSITTRNGFSVDIATISQTATNTTLTVTFNPTAEQAYNATLQIAGGGLANPEDVPLSGVGIIISDFIWGENFEYPAGSLLTANGWSAHSGAGTNPITVSEGSLSYLSYEPSGIGNKVTLTTSGEDVNSSFSDNITSGTLYAALMVNLTSAQSAGDYFAHFLGQSTSTFSGRIFARTSGSGYQLGVSKAANTGVYANELLNFGTTYLVVMKYEIVSGTTNDIVSLFVNPIVGNPEPVTADAIAADISGTDPTRIAGFALRQGTNTSAPQLALDGIRVAKTWDEAVKYLPATQVATPIFSPVAGTYYESQNVTISCITDEATIYYTTDGSTPTTSSTVYTTTIQVATTTTIKAFAVKAGLDNSEIAEAQYVINLTPFISINPTSYNFGAKLINGVYTKTFTVTTANLISDLTVSITGEGFSVDLSTIPQSATTTILTVSFNPTEIKAYSGTLNITGSGITNPEVVISGAGVIKPWEDFEEMTGSGSYGGANVTFATGLWRVVGFTTMDSNDRYNGLRSVRLRGNENDTCHVTMLFDKPNGLGQLKFKYGSYSTHSGGQISAFYSTNQGNSWNLIGSVIAPSWVAGGEQLLTAEFDVNVVGNVRIKIARDGSTAGISSVNIDDIEITDYVGTEPIILVSPTELNFGEVKIGETSLPLDVNIVAYNLTGGLVFTVSGDDAAAFSWSETKKNADEITLSVIFEPTVEKVYNAELNISSPGAESKSVILTGTGVSTILPVANFIADKTVISAGNTIQFTDLSTGNPTSWEWTFTGGTPATSTDQNPTVVYNQLGVFDVSLKVTNQDGNNTETKTNYITVYEPGSFFENFETIIAGSPSGNYSGSEITFESGTWYIMGVTVMDGNDRRNGERSVRLRGNATDTGHRAEMRFDKPNGAGVISFKYGSYSSHSGGTVQLFVSSDSGETWEAVGDEIVAPAWAAGGSVLHTAYIAVNRVGNIRIKIEKVNAAANTSINIDDIGISDYVGESPTIIVSPQEINFGEVKIGEVSTPQTINVAGYNLTENITYEVSADNLAFNISETDWNPVTGGALHITFEPISEVDYHALITFSSLSAESKAVTLSGTGVTVILPVANFIANKTTITTGNAVQFTDLSTGNPTTWEWTFEGGTPATSTEKNPTVVYEEVGVYDVTLKVTNVDGESTETKAGYITVNEQGPFFEDFEEMTGSGSYGGANVTFATGLWRVVGYTTMDNNDRRNGVRSVRLRGNAGDTCHVTMLFDKPNGLGKLKFKYGSYSSHSGGQISAYYSTDQGDNWNLIGSLIAPSWSEAGEKLLTAEFDVYVTGDVRIKIARDGATPGLTSVNIDDIEITDCYEPVPFITVSPSVVDFGFIDYWGWNNVPPQDIIVTGHNLIEDITYYITGEWSWPFDVTELEWNPAVGGTLSVSFSPQHKKCIIEYEGNLVLSSPGAEDKTVLLIGGHNSSIERITWGENITIYPNPVVDIMNFSNIEGIERVTITNIVGHKIMEFKPTTDKIDVTHLVRGIYLVSFQNKDGKTAVKRVVKR